MHPPTGRMIFEGVRPHFRSIFGMGLGAELFYSFVIIICSLMIYFGTKEIYYLSSHKGIKYFRQAFLFFSIAFFFRSFIKFLIMYFNITRIVDLSPQTFGGAGLLTQFLFMYFSSMAIFYILYSVMWKKWKDSNKIYAFHGLALLMAILSILGRSPIVYLWLNIFMLAIVIIVVLLSHKHKKKANSLFVIYLLLSVFWVLNIIETLIPDFFEGFQLFIYMASTGVFLLILYKVIKNTGVR